MSGRKRHERGQSLVEFALVLPLMLIMLFAILDFARVYTTMMGVESAAREAADFGTALTAVRWEGGTKDGTVAEMQRRACIAASNLTGYADPDGDPATGNCTNPSFTYCMTAPAAGLCVPVDPSTSVVPAGCDDTGLETPCRLTVALTFDFRLIAPLGIDFYGVHYGVPTSITLQRDSTFAMTDIVLSTGP